MAAIAEPTGTAARMVGRSSRLAKRPLVSDKRHTASEKKSARSANRSAEDLRSWEQVNQRLASLGETERQIRWLQDQFEEKVAVLKQEWLQATQPIASDKDRIKSQIERFFWAHRDEVLASGRKSVDLIFGRVGSRHSCKVMVRDADAVMAWLRDNGFKRYLRIRAELDREALRSSLVGGSGAAVAADAADLVRCPGLRLHESDEFWYEVDDSHLDRATLRDACPRSSDLPACAGNPDSGAEPASSGAAAGKL